MVILHIGVFRYWSCLGVFNLLKLLYVIDSFLIAHCFFFSLPTFENKNTENNCMKFYFNRDDLWPEWFDKVIKYTAY